MNPTTMNEVVGMATQYWESHVSWAPALRYVHRNDFCYQTIII